MATVVAQRVRQRVRETGSEEAVRQRKRVPCTACTLQQPVAQVRRGNHALTNQRPLGHHCQPSRLRCKAYRQTKVQRISRIRE